jgi:hypothetical protein
MKNLFFIKVHGKGFADTLEKQDNNPAPFSKWNARITVVSTNLLQYSSKVKNKN